MGQLESDVSPRHCVNSPRMSRIVRDLHSALAAAGAFDLAQEELAERTGPYATADQGCCIGGVARISAWWAKKCCRVAAATAFAPVPLEPPDTRLVTTIPGL